MLDSAKYAGKRAGNSVLRTGVLRLTGDSLLLINPQQCLGGFGMCVHLGLKAWLRVR
jgi:hypothetical protein